jgi:hypothetical protein
MHHSLLHWFYEGQWSEVQDLGGYWLDMPAVISWGPGRLDVFGRGGGNGLYQLYWNGHSWVWAQLPGQLIGTPALSSWYPGRLDVFTRGTDNGLWHYFYENGWGGPERLNTIYSDPSAVAWGVGRIDVFAEGPSNTLEHSYWSGWGWYNDNWGGTLTGRPEAVAWSANRLDIFGRAASDSSDYHWFWDGTNMASQDLGGWLTSGVSASSWGAGRLDTLVWGGDAKTVYYKGWNGSSWNEFQSMGIPFVPSRNFVTTVEWDTAGLSNSVEVHVNSPDGPLFAAGGPSGSAITGPWVNDGMKFYLQDASYNDPTNPDRTISVVTAYAAENGPSPAKGPGQLRFAMYNVAKAKAAAVAYANYCGLKYRYEPIQSRSVIYHQSRKCTANTEVGADVIYNVQTDPANGTVWVSQNLNFGYVGFANNMADTLERTQRILEMVKSYFKSFGLNYYPTVYYPPLSSTQNPNTFLDVPPGSHPGLTITLKDDCTRDSNDHWCIISRGNDYPTDAQVASSVAHEILHILGAIDQYGDDERCPAFEWTAPANNVMVFGGVLNLENTFVGLADLKRILSPICDPSQAPPNSSVVTPTSSSSGTSSSSISYWYDTFINLTPPQNQWSPTCVTPYVLQPDGVSCACPGGNQPVNGRCEMATSSINYYMNDPMSDQCDNMPYDASCNWWE